MIILSKVTKKEKDKYHINYMWNLKYDTNGTYLQNKNRLADTENRLVVVKGKGWIGSVGLADANDYI